MTFDEALRTAEARMLEPDECDGVCEDCAAVCAKRSGDEADAFEAPGQPEAWEL